MIFLHFPRDVWKLAKLASEGNRGNLPFTRTLIAMGTGGKNARPFLHLLCVVLQGMSRLRTLIMPSRQNYQVLGDVLKQHGITVGCGGDSKTGGRFIPLVRHLTVPSPSHALRLQQFRHIVSVVLTKPMTVARLTALEALLRHAVTLRRLAVCAGKDRSALDIMQVIIAFGQHVRVLSIRNGSLLVPVSSVATSLMVGLC